MKPDRKIVAVVTLVLVATVVLGWGVYRSFAQPMPTERGPRRAANDPRLRELMETHRQERDEWMVRYANASPPERRQMLLQQQAESEQRRTEWRERREQRPEGERPERPEDDRRRGRDASPEERAERVAGGNPQRQALRGEMRRTRRENGIDSGGRGGGPRGPR